MKSYVLVGSLLPPCWFPYHVPATLRRTHFPVCVIMICVFLQSLIATHS